jgi:hypothetical protein
MKEALGVVKKPNWASIEHSWIPRTIQVELMLNAQSVEQHSIENDIWVSAESV